MSCDHVTLVHWVPTPSNGRKQRLLDKGRARGPLGTGGRRHRSRTFEILFRTGYLVSSIFVTDPRSVRLLHEYRPLVGHAVERRCRARTGTPGLRVCPKRLPHHSGSRRAVPSSDVEVSSTFDVWMIFLPCS